MIRMTDIEQGYQLSLDLNFVVARGKNWSMPFFWVPL